MRWAWSNFLDGFLQELGFIQVEFSPNFLKFSGFRIFFFFFFFGRSNFWIFSGAIFSEFFIIFRLPEFFLVQFLALIFFLDGFWDLGFLRWNFLNIFKNFRASGFFFWWILRSRIFLGRIFGLPVIFLDGFWDLGFF